MYCIAVIFKVAKHGHQKVVRASGGKNKNRLPRE